MSDMSAFKLLEIEILDFITFFHMGIQRHLFVTEQDGVRTKR